MTSRPVLAAALALLLSLLVSGCASAPPAPRADLPLPARGAPSVPVVAQQVNVIGHQGRLTRDEREALIRRLGEQGRATLLQRHVAAMATYGEVDLYAGNEAKLLVDGPATYAAMLQAIERARHTILLESYIIEESGIAQRLAALLARKQREGVQVRLLYDAIGSIGNQGYFEQLRATGLATCAFNPLNPATRASERAAVAQGPVPVAPPAASGPAGPTQKAGYWDITHRDHRKILVVDREIGFTGGINISAVYSSGSFGGRGRGRPDSAPVDREDGWRDTQIQLRGPAAAALDDLVRQVWQQQQCEAALPAPPPAAVPVARAPAGDQVVRIVPATPDDAFNRIYALLLTAIDASQRSIHLTMAYFAPGKDMVEALCDAAGRGVDVQLVLPSVSDFSPVLHAGRSYYDQLLGCRVKLYELQDAVLHAKTAVIDGVVSTVGSSNLDWRSFSGNSEVNAVVLGEDFGAAMTQMFRRDVAVSQAITPEAWRERPLLQRAKETLARLFETWW